jgi:ABC-type lipoprotein release transport system permease subunit
LYGTSGHDPLVLTTALGVLALSTLAAAWLPAMRAAALDPIKALRQE